MKDKITAWILGNTVVSLTSFLPTILQEVPSWGSFLISLITATASIVMGYLVRKDNSAVKKAQAREINARAEEVNYSTATFDVSYYTQSGGVNPIPSGTPVQAATFTNQAELMNWLGDAIGATLSTSGVENYNVFIVGSGSPTGILQNITVNNY